MLLTLTTTHRPATNLGYLLEKHPARAQAFPLAWGMAHVFYPEADEARCTAALLVEVDALRLAKAARRRGDEGLASHYVNDRPYAASSLLSVALAKVFSSALRGQSRERQELADTPIPLEARLPALPCRGGEHALTALFEPLGYEIEHRRLPLDPRFSEWGASPYFSVTLRAETTLSALLSHLYVLVPVLDDAKHYFVGLDEVEKLVTRGEGWLASHPARERIALGYLRRHRHLTRAALARLTADEDPDPDETSEREDEEEAAIETRVGLDQRRRDAVIDVLREHGAAKILDLGCGEGKLVRALASSSWVERVLGVDVAVRALEIAARRMERLPARARQRAELAHGSMVYRDPRFSGFDAICLIEVVEHVDPPRLDALARVVLGDAAPPLVVLTTPNREHNRRFASLPAGTLRHRDHRFEWTRAELAAWAGAQAERFGYTVRFVTVGDDDPEVGPPTQMAVFTRGGAS